MPGTIEHVVVLALENRSFDHMLGFMPHPDPGFDGLTTGGPYTNPGWDGGSQVVATDDAKVVLPVGPDHSHDAAMEQLALQQSGTDLNPTNQGFVTSYERICRGLSPPAFGGLLGGIINWFIHRSPPTPIPGRGPLAMACQPPTHLPVLSQLAQQFAVCTRWFCSVPGETWPNRNFLHAATSDGETNINMRFYTNRTIFELLEDHGRSWHIYYDDTPEVWAFVNLWDSPERHANWYEFPAFAEHVAAGDLPTYSFIEPNHRPILHDLDHEPIIGSPDVSDSQHPSNNLVSNAAYDTFPDTTPSDFTRAETLVANVFEALRKNPDIFNRTLLLITYDEHGGLYDHVPPPTDVPNPGIDPTLLRRILRAIYHRKSQAFDFRTLGPRVPAVVVSPYIDPGTLCTDVHDHASVPATLRALFAPSAAPLTTRDAWAKPFHSVLRRSTPRSDDLPDLSAYTAPTAPTAGTASTAAAGQRVLGSAGLGTKIPNHYQPWIDLADSVRGRLAAKGVPDSQAVPGVPSLERAARTAQLFTAAAHRARIARS